MPKNLGGHVTLATPTFQKLLQDHVRTVPGNMRVKFEVRSCNRFGAIIDESAAHRHTHAQAHIGRKQYLRGDSAIHSVHLAEISTQAFA